MVKQKLKNMQVSQRRLNAQDTSIQVYALTILFHVLERSLTFIMRANQCNFRCMQISPKNKRISDSTLSKLSIVAIWYTRTFYNEQCSEHQTFQFTFAYNPIRNCTPADSLNLFPPEAQTHTHARTPRERVWGTESIIQMCETLRNKTAQRIQCTAHPRSSDHSNTWNSSGREQQKWHSISVNNKIHRISVRECVSVKCVHATWCVFAQRTSIDQYFQTNNNIFSMHANMFSENISIGFAIQMRNENERCNCRCKCYS